MIYTKPPLTIKDYFANAAEKSSRGENANWCRLLVICGIIDSDRTTKQEVVCTQISCYQNYDDLAQKIDWLRPYGDSDPLIAEVIKLADANLKMWENKKS